MRTIVIGDIHGGYRALEQLIKRIGLREDDRLIFVGDYVDGWSESYETVSWLMEFSLSRKRNNHQCPIYIKGNHDQLFLNDLKHETRNQMWLESGGQSTLDSYRNQPAKEIARHQEFLDTQLMPYYVDKQNRLYIHAGFTNLKGPDFEYFKETPYWDRTLWEMAIAVDPKMSTDDKRYPTRLKLYHEIFLGHTPTKSLDIYEPVQGRNVWNLDTAAAYKGPLSAMDVDTKQVWQSDPVHTLYPNENGRN